jgi:hypothetical protein
MLKRISPILFAMMVAQLIVGCGGNQQETPAEEVIDTAAVAPNRQEIEENFIMTLPSPLQLASIFRRSGLEYVAGLTNPHDNVSKYNTKNSQKLNFGVYSADLAYSALNDQNQDCINYVKNIGVLSERLWLTNIFSSVSVLKRFEDNMGDSDSLGYVIADIQMDLDSYLDENGLSQNSILIFSGAWVESMYIGLRSITEKPNPKLASRLIEQKKIINNLVKVLEADETQYMNDIVRMVSKVNTHFDKFEGIEDLDEESMLEKYAFTELEQQNLLADVEELRNKIING